MAKKLTNDERERQCGRRAAEAWATKPGRSMEDIEAVAEYSECCDNDEPISDKLMRQLNVAFGCDMNNNNNIPIGIEFKNNRNGEYIDAWYATIWEIARKQRH